MLLLIWHENGSANSNGVCVYTKTNYQGVRVCYSPNLYAKISASLNNAISSITIPAGYAVQAYDGADFTGERWDFKNNNTPDLKSAANRIESLKITRDTRVWTSTRSITEAMLGMRAQRCLTNSNGLALLTNRASECPPHRQDLFGMISAGDGQYCLTVPDQIRTGSSWGTVEYQKCRVSDKKQVWSISTGADRNTRLFAVHYPSYRLFVDLNNAHVFMSTNSEQHQQFYINIDNSETSDFSNNQAQPRLMSLNAFLTWTHNDMTYPLFNNGVVYLEEYGLLVTDNNTCLKSNMRNSVEYAYVIEDACPEPYSSASEKFKWWLTTQQDNVTKKNKIIVYNHDGSRLVNSIWGYEWGVPYTASPDYVVTNANKNWLNSYFSASNETIDTHRAIARNNFKQGITCNGSTDMPRKPIHREIKNINITTDDWIDLLYQIATSTSDKGAGRSAGICGVCALHSAEMAISIINHYYFGANFPTTSGVGNLFKLGSGDPIRRFQERYGARARLLTDQASHNNHALRPHLPNITDSERVAMGLDTIGMMFSTLIPGYMMSTVNYNSSSAFLDAYNHMSTSTRSNTFIVSVFYSPVDSLRAFGGHSVYMQRDGNNSLRLVETNLNSNQSRSVFAESVRSSINNPEEFISRLRGAIDNIDGQEVRSISITEIGAPVAPLTFTSGASFDNCTGNGPGGRGNGAGATGSSMSFCSGNSCQM